MRTTEINILVFITEKARIYRVRSNIVEFRIQQKSLVVGEVGMKTLKERTTLG